MTQLNQVLEYLQFHGEGSDCKIAKATGLRVEDVRSHFSQLAADQTAMTCRLIKYEKEQEIEEILCRLIGFDRPYKPLRRAKT